MDVMVAQARDEGAAGGRHDRLARPGPEAAGDVGDGAAHDPDVHRGPPIHFRPGDQQAGAALRRPAGGFRRSPIGGMGEHPLSL
jgi:hypothetical protein